MVALNSEAKKEIYRWKLGQIERIFENILKFKLSNLILNLNSWKNVQNSDNIDLISSVQIKGKDGREVRWRRV